MQEIYHVSSGEEAPLKAYPPKVIVILSAVT